MANKKRGGNDRNAARSAPRDAPEQASQSRPAEPPPLVCMGAAQGGAEALAQLLGSLTAAPGLAIVFAPRPPLQGDDGLVALLSKAAPMPVLSAQDGQPLAADQVYVAPSHLQCRVEKGKLWLSEIPSGRRDGTVVDLLFRSAADALSHRALGVVLSGAGSDGAGGLWEIAMSGGMGLVQAPDAAACDEMPSAALAGGGAERGLTVEELAACLEFLARHPYLQTSSSADDFPLSERQMTRLLELLQALVRVDGSQYQGSVVKRRLLRRMALSGKLDVDDYLDGLEQTPVEARRLYQDLLSPPARFRSDGRSLSAAAEAALAGLLEDRPRGEMLRVWAPGCARGEEAYAAAIALAAACEARSTPAEIKVFGADANEHAIKRARSGSYPIIIADEISDGRLTDFFQAFGGTCRVKREIREMCVFAQQDALQDPPFSHLNLIVCGGSLASLTAAAQRNLLDRFSYGLRPGGLLLLAEEMSTPDGERFVRVDERLPLYRKLTAEGSPGAGAASPPAARTAAESKASHESHVQREANRVLLDRYAPPGVIVDDHFHIVQFQGRIGRYLSPASGEASLNLLRMVGDGLIYGLKAAINDARTHGAAARREGLRVELDGEGPLVNIEVVPLEPTSERRHYLVLFEGPALAADAKGRPGAPQPAKRSSTARRQREMALNQEYLQSVIHDLEQANTELQAAIEEVLSSNEELQSSNEELDASQEELQSTNEELNTVNDELHSRNRELDQVNQDLMSLFSNLHIAVVMVSRNLRIRRFTPLAGKLLNLIPGDIGRPVSHIKPAFECPELAPLIADAVRQGKVEEFNVSDSSGKHYSLSLRPYSGRDGRIAGVLLTLVDN